MWFALTDDSNAPAIAIGKGAIESGVIRYPASLDFRATFPIDHYSPQVVLGNPRVMDFGVAEFLTFNADAGVQYHAEPYRRGAFDTMYALVAVGDKASGHFAVGVMEMGGPAAAIAEVVIEKQAVRYVHGDRRAIYAAAVVCVAVGYGAPGDYGAAV